MSFNPMIFRIDTVMERWVGFGKRVFEKCYYIEAPDEAEVQALLGELIFNHRLQFEPFDGYGLWLLSIDEIASCSFHETMALMENKVPVLAQGQEESNAAIFFSES